MRNLMKDRLRRRVLVSCKSGDAFRGIYYEDDKRVIVLVDAEHIQPATDKQFVPADGEIVILLADVAYFQFV